MHCVLPSISTYMQPTRVVIHHLVFMCMGERRGVEGCVGFIREFLGVPIKTSFCYNDFPEEGRKVLVLTRKRLPREGEGGGGGDGETDDGQRPLCFFLFFF